MDAGPHDVGVKNKMSVPLAAWKVVEMSLVELEAGPVLREIGR
jgi:hypothetical protein